MFKGEIGKSTSLIDDNMKIRIGNWIYKMSDLLVTQADEMLLMTNGDDKGTDPIVTKSNTNEILNTECTMENANQKLITLQKTFIQ